MPSESKPLLTVKTEKPNHYTYLKEFRVEQCPLFLQHKCTQHRPFTCFHWHFNNQRRRRPVRKRDGVFNYSADNYCPNYDETTGICPDGDECSQLHRTAGDTERRYHLRYYKTCMCVHDTDTRGFCAKNGPHCAFAHGNNDLRSPVYDIKEMQALENSEGDNGATNGPNALDKERNLMNEDPKWQDTNYVLSCYKTEPCKRPPRLCRQGYACPQYHNSRDKRRSPRKYKYRSTPCPNVKHGDEWGEPSSCDNGDGCPYCHTRTEQQFHPEIYKSTKCKDVETAGYCPRGVFCAFAHLDHELSIAKELSGPLELGSLSDIVSAAVPSLNRDGDNNGDNIPEIRDTISRSLDNDLVSSFDESSNSLFMNVASVSPPSSHNQNLLLPVQFPSLDPPPMDPVILGTLDDLSLDEMTTMERDYDNDSPTMTNSLSAGISSGILGGSAPVNIPGSRSMGIMRSYSPSTASPLQHLQSGYLSSRFAHNEALLDSTFLTGSHGSSKFGGSLTNGNFDTIMSPGRTHPLTNSPLISYPLSPSHGGNVNLDSREPRSSKITAHDEWQKEVDEANRKANIAEQQRDEAMNQAKKLQKEMDLLQGSPYLHGIRRVSELKTLPLTTLKSIQAQLKSDLEQVDKELHLQTGQKCMVCSERNRSVTVGPCKHYVMCSACAPDQKNCPYCQATIVAHTSSTPLHA